MIVCPNCHHQNPEVAVQCEACYTPLPMKIDCPSCGASVQTNASFCGQCGYQLDSQVLASSPPISTEDVSQAATEVEEPPSINGVISSSSGLDAEKEKESLNQDASTQLQIQIPRLIHEQTDTVIELPQSLETIHIGKPNDRVPPDIDVAGLPHSNIVSRIHADILMEGDAYYIEDVGSSNGTYVNHKPLPQGNRHRLRSGDRIALGKENKVTFIFTLS